MEDKAALAHADGVWLNWDDTQNMNEGRRGGGGGEVVGVVGIVIQVWYFPRRDMFLGGGGIGSGTSSAAVGGDGA